VRLTTRSLSTSSQCCHRKKYRSLIGASMDPMHGAPDYSYRDGREVPMGYNNRIRHQRQRELAADCLRMLNELEYAERRHELMEAERVLQRQATIGGKLKRGTLSVDPQELRDTSGPSGH